ncbi:acetate--CoA ligase family protein [Ramlibacter sp. Leaf400]|uniref:acetate--CoA ligase family protein n=1 Tax=Ramlibacter sp. Leaf400 TaxID=1736365 RepID=UPI0006FC491B|nr:acetate--CoA ligase family protein [Ramlibacter sp. Leaf400]KQT13325.1 CoA-binding protein [Ramlibacter sp. Leaf400]
MAHRLDPLLAPRSIAVLGASNDPARIGGMGIDLLRHFGYPGTVYPVNPKYKLVQGLESYPDVASLPEAPDLVVVAIAAPEVTAALRQCHARGIRAAIVYGAGFAEAGAAGAALQRDLEAFAAESGMVIAGPNCMGFANLNARVFTAFAGVFRATAPQERPGRVSLLTQSGNVCAAVFALLRGVDVGVSHFINTGNEATLEFSQYLDYLVQDDATDCVVGYVEQLRDGPAFIDAAVRFARANKPLILYKAGETEKGAEAVRSHTSALAGNLALYRTAFRQLNVIQAEDFAQMADLAMLSALRDRTAGRRVGVLTLSGALGAILADKFSAAGLEVPTLPAATQARFRGVIPDYGMVSNPVDCTGNIVNDPGRAASILEALATAPEVDVVVIYAMGALLDRMADPLMDVVRRHGRLFVVIDTGLAKRRAELAAAGVPVFTDLGRAVQAIAPFCRWHAGRAATLRWAGLRDAAGTDRETLHEAPNEYESKRLLARYGVEAVAEAPAGDEATAVAQAQRLGFPVALKILSADIAHKTEIGGVRLNLGDADAVRMACRQVLAAARERAPGARIDGVLVQKMSTGVAELIAGVTRDEVFGAALTVGLGGVLTEIYQDVSHRLLPVDETLAREMLGELKARALLEGFRGRPRGDVAAAAAGIAGLARAAEALRGSVREIEVNPLLVRAEGEGAVALDALLLPEAR